MTHHPLPDKVECFESHSNAIAWDPTIQTLGFSSFLKNPQILSFYLPLGGNAPTVFVRVRDQESVRIKILLCLRSPMPSGLTRPRVFLTEAGNFRIKRAWAEHLV